MKPHPLEDLINACISNILDTDLYQWDDIAPHLTIHNGQMMKIRDNDMT